MIETNNIKIEEKADPLVRFKLIILQNESNRSDQSPQASYSKVKLEIQSNKNKLKIKKLPKKKWVNGDKSLIMNKSTVYLFNKIGEIKNAEEMPNDSMQKYHFARMNSESQGEVKTNDKR